MKKIIFLALTTLTLALCNCGKYNDIPGNEGELSEDLIVSVVIEQIEQHMMSFSVDTTNAERISYVVIEASKEAPSASFVLLNGESVPIDSKEPVVVTGLSSSTYYKLLIAAEGAGKTTMVNPITFRTIEEAFIGFSGTKATESIPEAKDGAVTTYALSLECASIKGVTAQVAFAAVDTNYEASKRAVEGVDYVFKAIETYTLDAQCNRLNVVTTDLTAGADKIVKFDADHRFASIYIETIDNNIQDGDKKFDVVLSNVQGCKLGAKKLFAITIADDENPLNQLLGVYNATTPSAFQGYPDENWEVTIVADDETEGKIWIQPIITISGLSAGDIAPVYATVDLAQGIIQMPYGQTVYGGEGQSYNMVIAGLDNNPILSGVAVATYDLSDGAVITFQNGYGVGNLAGNEWWYNAYQAPVFTKK